MMRANLSEVKQGDRITLICHHDDIVVVNDRPDVVTISPEDTLAQAKLVTPELWARMKQDQNFLAMFRKVFPDLGLHMDLPLQSHGMGVQHVVGLIILTLSVYDQGKVPHWKFPESYLHPSAQLGLADLAIALTGGNDDPVAQQVG